MTQMRLLALAAALSGLALAGGGLAMANQARDRGSTPIQQSTMPRTEREPYGAVIARPYRGLLVDAGCADRTLHNLRLPPAPFASSIAGLPPGTPSANQGSAYGITVSPQTLEGERADIMPHQVPDMRTRQKDPTCAITGSTTAFSLILPNGRLLNLDAGGNTYAWQGVYSTAAGRAMLNGMAPGFKPFASLKGFIQGSTLVVETPIEVAEMAPLAPPPSGGMATRMKARR